MHARSNTFHSVRDFKLKKPDIQFLAKIIPKSDFKQPRFLSSKLLYEQSTAPREPSAASTFHLSENAQIKLRHKTMDLSQRKQSNQIGSLIKSNDPVSATGKVFNKRHSSMQIRSESIGSEGVMTNNILENKFNQAFKKVSFMKTHESKPTPENLPTEKNLPKEASILEDCRKQAAQSYRISSLKLLKVNKKDTSTIVSFRKLEVSKTEVTEAPIDSRMAESSRVQAGQTNVGVIRDTLVKEFKQFLLNERVSSQLSKNLDFFVKEDDLSRLKDFNTVSDSAREKGSNFLTTFLDAIGESDTQNARRNKTSGSLLDTNFTTGEELKAQNLFDRKITNDIKEEFQRKKIHSLINNYADKYGIELSKSQQTGTGLAQTNPFMKLDPVQQKALLFKRKKSDFRKKFDVNLQSELENFPNLKKAVEYRNQSELEVFLGKKSEHPANGQRTDPLSSRTRRARSTSTAVQVLPDTVRGTLHDPAVILNEPSHRKNCARFPFKFSIGENANHSLVQDEALAIKFRILDQEHMQEDPKNSVDDLEKVRSESFNRQVPSSHQFAKAEIQRQQRIELKQRMCSKLVVLLRKLEWFKVSLKEAAEHRVFPRKEDPQHPMINPFILAVKSNDRPKVERIIEADRFIVYHFDAVVPPKSEPYDRPALGCQ